MKGLSVYSKSTEVITVSKEGEGCHTSMIDRQAVYDKWRKDVLTQAHLLKDDWQVDHIVPKEQGGTDDINNLYPAQRIVNHYKRCLDNEKFRTWLLGGLHETSSPRTRERRKEKAEGVPP